MILMPIYNKKKTTYMVSANNNVLNKVIIVAIIYISWIDYNRYIVQYVSVILMNLFQFNRSYDYLCNINWKLYIIQSWIYYIFTLIWLRERRGWEEPIKPYKVLLLSPKEHFRIQQTPKTVSVIFLVRFLQLTTVPIQVKSMAVSERLNYTNFWKLSFSCSKISDCYGKIIKTSKKLADPVTRHGYCLVNKL